MKLIRALFYKNGEVSKTAILLTLGSFALMGLWIFQSLFAGAEFGGWWTVPEFNATAGVTILFTFSALYVTNHKIRGSQETITPAEITELCQQVGDLVQSVKGSDQNGD